MKINIVGDGDSIMYGLTALPQSMPVQLLALLQARGDGNTYTMHNIGISSTTLPEIDTRFATNAATLHDPTADYNIYMLWGGGNDLHFGLGLNAAKTAYDSIVSKAVAAGFEVLSLNIIQRGNAGGTLELLQAWRTNADLLNAYMWANLAATPVDVQSCWPSFDWSIDPWQSTMWEGQRPPEYNDWAHPSSSGHAPVAALLVTTLVALIEPPVETPAAYIKQRVGGVVQQYPLYATGDIPQRVGNEVLYLRYGGTSGIKQGVTGVVQELTL